MFTYTLLLLAVCLFGWLHRREEYVLHEKSVRLVIADTRHRSLSNEH